MNNISHENSSFYNITIYGYLGSYAEQYAREYYLKFEPITISLYSSNINISEKINGFSLSKVLNLLFFAFKFCIFFSSNLSYRWIVISLIILYSNPDDIKNKIGCFVIALKLPVKIKLVPIIISVVIIKEYIIDNTFFIFIKTSS